MKEELLPRLGDVIEDVELLLDLEFSFERAKQRYADRIIEVGSARERFFEIT